MITGALVALLAALAIYLTSAPALLGAHPMWATSVIGIGAPLGIFGFLALIKTNRHLVLGLSIFGLLLAYASVSYGKARFVASFGDDAIAGRMWYFGWIAICVFVPLSLASVVNWMTVHRRK